MIKILWFEFAAGIFFLFWVAVIPYLIIKLALTLIAVYLFARMFKEVE